MPQPTLHLIPPAVEPGRPTPGMIAPERCVTSSPSICEGYTVLVGRDLGGHVRIKVELASDDVSEWWLRAIRRWIAWRYGAAELVLLK